MLVEALEEERKRLVAQDLEKMREKIRAEVWAEGRAEGRAEGMEKGELIGSIRVLQRILRRPVSEELTLREHDLDALQQILQELEAALKDSPIMS